MNQTEIQNISRLIKKMVILLNIYNCDTTESSENFYQEQSYELFGISIWLAQRKKIN